MINILITFDNEGKRSSKYPILVRRAELTYKQALLWQKQKHSEHLSCRKRNLLLTTQVCETGLQT